MIRNYLRFQIFVQVDCDRHRIRFVVVKLWVKTAWYYCCVMVVEIEKFVNYVWRRLHP